MKHLYILRHAKTNQISKTGKDFDRALLPKGFDQLKDLQLFFDSFSLKNDVTILISSAKRTIQTFEGVKNVLQNKNSISTYSFHKNLYLAELDELLKVIWNLQTDDNIFLIGHNFGISELASYFTESDIELSTSEFIHLSFQCNHWNETSKGLAIVENRYHPLKNTNV